MAQTPALLASGPSSLCGQIGQVKSPLRASQLHRGKPSLVCTRRHT